MLPFKNCNAALVPHGLRVNASCNNTSMNLLFTSFGIQKDKYCTADESDWSLICFMSPQDNKR